MPLVYAFGPLFPFLEYFYHLDLVQSIYGCRLILPIVLTVDLQWCLSQSKQSDREYASQG